MSKEGELAHRLPCSLCPSALMPCPLQQGPESPKRDSAGLLDRETRRSGPPGVGIVHCFMLCPFRLPLAQLYFSFHQVQTPSWDPVGTRTYQSPLNSSSQAFGAVSISLWGGPYPGLLIEGLVFYFPGPKEALTQNNGGGGCSQLGNARDSWKGRGA